MVSGSRVWGNGQRITEQDDQQKDAQRKARDAPLQGRHPYDVSKSCADLIAQSYAHTYGLPVAVTRCANLYGGGDLNFSRLIPEAVSAALSGRAPVLRSDGSPERDFLFVEDAASAYLAIADGLDRSHFSVVQDLDVKLGKPVTIRVYTSVDAELELWAARNRADLFENVFKRTLSAQRV